MKVAMVLLAVAAALLIASRAFAYEGPDDVESDHIDAFDQRGPRTLGLLVNPGAILLGGIGAEADFGLSDTVAVSAEAEAFSVDHVRALGAELGVPLFLQRIPFHGLYVHPRVAWSRVGTGGATVDIEGLGASAGWEWTLRAGFTVRLGVGAMFERSLELSVSKGADALRARPLVDGALGWVF